jgi:hypothetical protein
MAMRDVPQRREQSAQRQRWPAVLQASNDYVSCWRNDNCHSTVGPREWGEELVKFNGAATFIRFEVLTPTQTFYVSSKEYVK